MAVKQTLTLTQESQNILNNYSTVRVLWQSTQSGESWNGYSRTANYWVSINGGAETKYSVKYTLPKKSTKTILDISIVVPHNSDGTGSIKVRTWMDTDIYEGVVTKSQTLTLTPIPRGSYLSVSDGVLDLIQQIHIEKAQTGYTHSIRYTCGNESGSVTAETGAAYVDWTPPIELASQNPQGDTVPITLITTSFNSGVKVGEVSQTFNYKIPDNIAPFFYITKTDPTGLYDVFGDFVVGKSKLQFKIEAYSGYGAWITGCEVTFEGITYTGGEFETDVFTKTGSHMVQIAVTDSRGRVTRSEEDIYVLSYAPPIIEDVSVYRSNADGSSNPSGSFLTVKFSGEMATLNGGYSPLWQVKYKKNSSTSTKTETAYDGFLADDTLFTFPADISSSYDIRFIAKDYFTQAERSIYGPSAKKVWSLLKKDGEIVGASVGKTAELEDCFDIGFQTRFLGGILHPVLPSTYDLDLELTPKTYMLLSANTYLNAPEEKIGALLEIVGIKDTSLIQRFSVFSSTNPRVYERTYFSGNWNEWICVRGDFVVEQGESDGWTYRKWNSGIAECTKTLEHKTKISKSWGSMYVGDTLMSRQNYPFPFLTKPKEIASVASGNAAVWLFAESQGNGVNGAYASAIYNVCRPNSNSTENTFYITISASGKWK